ncbi:MAG TPA: prepilin-type N-terminal cleavage/methylation domain-containing protein, partial [Pyrinomonadaceae bacterium]|nr:prepilin-type N-terminal cleavage/methylation domain-containing protein [Pyrinomonadaceae bacterium]
MLKKNQNGFSLIELLIVLVVLGIIASLAVPGLRRAKRVTENESAYNTLRVMVTTQLSFNASNGRYARLNELNAVSNNALGTMSGNQLLRSKFTFEMIPSAPDDEQLKGGYVITVVKDAGNETPYTLNVNESGRIVEPFNNLQR